MIQAARHRGTDPCGHRAGRSGAVVEPLRVRRCRARPKSSPRHESPDAISCRSGCIIRSTGPDRPRARIEACHDRVRGIRASVVLAPESRRVLVTLDRPEVLNAADVRMHREMSDVWAVIDADDDVAVSVVTGAGRAFSAGGDLAMIEEMTHDYEALLVQWRDAGAIVERMLAARKPVVSAINGVAVGAGLAVALLADVSVCRGVGEALGRARPARCRRRGPRRACCGPCSAGSPRRSTTC